MNNICIHDFFLGGGGREVKVHLWFHIYSTDILITIFFL